MNTPGHNLGPPPPRDQDRLGHAPVLDGLRGLAVLAVLGHNLEIPGFIGGFLGVDIFFALSGFLITTLLLEEYGQHGVISLPGFFRRRFLRLYPAFVVLVIVSALSSFLRHDVGGERVALVVASMLTYLSNWLLIADDKAWVGGLGHTWSLAVEMHFYVLWALTLALVTGRWRARLGPLLALALAAAAASAVWRIIVWDDGAQIARAYAGTDTRLDAIFLGVAAALFRLRHLSHPTLNPVARLARWKVRTVEILLAVAIAGLIARTPPFSPVAFLGGFGLVGGATAVLILTTLLNRHSLLVRPLQAGILVWFGHISYSLYLWQQPVKKFVTAERLSSLGEGVWLVAAIRVVASVALAVASYYCIERTFLRWRRRAENPVPKLS